MFTLKDIPGRVDDLVILEQFPRTELNVPTHMSLDF